MLPVGPEKGAPAQFTVRKAEGETRGTERRRYRTTRKIAQPVPRIWKADLLDDE